MNYRFLKAYRENVIGPVQKSEALFLYALTCIIRPKMVLEIGSAQGHSTRCFLEGGAERVIAVDLKITPELEALALAFPTLEIIKGSQESFALAPLRNDPIDILFLDASHRFDLDCATFARLIPHLRGETIVVHDTALWRKQFMRPSHFRHIERHGTTYADDCVHQPDVLPFITWLKGQGMHCIDLGSDNCLRHGFSLLQFTC